MSKQRNNRPSIYGFHAVAEAWLNPERSVYNLYMTSSAEKGFEHILREASQKNITRPNVTMVEKRQLEKMLPQGAVHQGLALEVSGLPETDIHDMIIGAQARKRTVLLMLDQVTDPHNVGAIMRSACALGAHGVIMQKKHAPSLSGVLAKTACGGIEHIPVAYETNLSRCIEALKEGGFFAYGLDERGSDIGAITLPEKTVLILGAEGPGLRRLVSENCDELVKIPMVREVASINVSNAAAIALYAFCHQG